MIIRRLAEGIRKQDWFVVVLEIFIVVVGIFLGLQVDDWHQGIQDRALEARYLERLKDDLENDLALFDRSDFLADVRTEQIDLVLSIIEKPEAAGAAPDAFIVAVRKSGWSSYRPISRPTYTELFTTGRMALIRSEKLRTALAGYYSSIDNWEEILSETRAASKYNDATAGLLNKDTLATIEDTAFQDGPEVIGADPADAVALAVRLASLDEATRWLPYMHAQHYLLRIVNAENRQEVKALIEQIGALLIAAGVTGKK